MPPVRVDVMAVKSPAGSCVRRAMIIFCGHLYRYRVEFFMNDGKTFRTFLLDYEEVLDRRPVKAGFCEAQALLFERLREWRKGKAEQSGVFVYIVCTNRELEEIVRRALKSLEALKIIKGMGRKKIAGNTPSAYAACGFEKNTNHTGEYTVCFSGVRVSCRGHLCWCYLFGEEDRLLSLILNQLIGYWDKQSFPWSN